MDIIRLKNGYKPKVGDVLDHTLIEDIYDIKSTLSGTLSGNQLGRLKLVRNGWPRGGRLPAKPSSVKTVTVPERYTQQGWENNPRYVTAIKIFSAVFAAKQLANSAYGTINASEYDHELDEINTALRQISNETDKELQDVSLYLLLKDKVRVYLEHFIPSEAVTNLAVEVAARGLWSRNR